MKEAVLENFRNIQRKTPALESLFNKFIGRKACNFINERLQHRCFPVDIVKFLRTASSRLLLEEFIWEVFNFMLCLDHKILGVFLYHLSLPYMLQS